MQTNRRSFIAATAVATVAASVPVIAADRNERWQRAKARFLNAHQRTEAAGKAHDAMENEQSLFAKDAPTRELTYTEQGWAIAHDGVKIDAQPRDARFILSRQNIHHAPQELKASAEYAAFTAELVAWRDRYNAQGDLRGWDAIEREWNAALDAKLEAWRAMVSCPVSTAADMAEKVRLARLDDFPDESDLHDLLDALQADMARTMN